MPQAYSKHMRKDLAVATCFVVNKGPPPSSGTACAALLGARHSGSQEHSGGVVAVQWDAMGFAMALSVVCVNHRPLPQVVMAGQSAPVDTLNVLTNEMQLEVRQAHIETPRGITSSLQPGVTVPPRCFNAATFDSSRVVASRSVRAIC